MISKRVFLIAAALVVLMTPLMADAQIIINGNTYYGVNTNFVVVNTLSIQGATSVLNLTNVGASPLAHYLISNTTDFPTINGYVMSGRNGGTWDGPGITSDIVALSPSKLALATLTGAEWTTGLGYSTFHLNNVAASPALVQLTYAGDVNLDGNLNGDDLALVKSNLLQQAKGTVYAPHWVNGDVTYDGNINGDDLAAVKSDLLQQAKAVPSPYPTIDTGTAVAGSAAAVPEPSTIVMVLLAAFSFLGVRKYWK